MDEMLIWTLSTITSYRHIYPMDSIDNPNTTIVSIRVDIDDLETADTQDIRHV